MQSANFQAVLVTDGASEVAAYLEGEEPSPMTYGSPPGADVIEDDKTIEKLAVQVADITIVPVEEMFQR